LTSSPSTIGAGEVDLDALGGPADGAAALPAGLAQETATAITSAEREALAEAGAELGSDADASELPRLLERPLSSPVKLVDEHDWVGHTRGFTPPAPEVTMEWSRWASGRRG
jgi:8-oxo-dGTP pyrophosphatase MutT (NUDIX family)